MPAKSKERKKETDREEEKEQQRETNLSGAVIKVMAWCSWLGVFGPGDRLRVCVADRHTQLSTHTQLTHTHSTHTHTHTHTHTIVDSYILKEGDYHGGATLQVISVCRGEREDDIRNSSNTTDTEML